MQAGVIDEDVAGLVVGLFDANDPEHEQLHLAVRTQVCSLSTAQARVRRSIIIYGGEMRLSQM